MDIETSLVSEICAEKERMLSRYLTPMLRLFTNELFVAADEKGLEASEMYASVAAFVDWPAAARSDKIKRFLSILGARYKHFDINVALRARIIASVCVHSASLSKACGTRVVVAQTIVETFISDLLDNIVLLVADEGDRNLSMCQFRRLAEFAVSDSIIDVLSKHRFSQRDVLLDAPTDPSTGAREGEEEEEEGGGEQGGVEQGGGEQGGSEQDHELDELFPRDAMAGGGEETEEAEEAEGSDSSGGDEGAEKKVLDVDASRDGSSRMK